MAGGQLHDAPLVVTVSFWVKIFYHAHQNEKTLFLNWVPKLNIMVLPMQWQILVGFKTYYGNFTHLSAKLLSCIVIMSVWFICLQLQCNINTQNILKLTFTLFEIKLQLARSVLHVPSSLQYAYIFAKRLLAFDLVWVFTLDLPLKLWGHASVYIYFVFIAHCSPLYHVSISY